MTPTGRQWSRTVRLTIFLSYGAILQSSFDTIFSIVLAYNASPPVSVLGTVDNPHFSHQDPIRKRYSYTAALLSRRVPGTMLIGFDCRLYLRGRVAMERKPLSKIKPGAQRQRWSAVIRYLYQHWLSCLGLPAPYGGALSEQLVPLQMKSFFISLFRCDDWAPQHFRSLASSSMSFNALPRAWLLPSLAFEWQQRTTSRTLIQRLKNLNKRSGLFPSWPVTLAPQACLAFMVCTLFGVSLSSVTIRHRPSNRELLDPVHPAYSV